MVAMDGKTYRIGGYTIDTACYRISQGDTPVPVEPKVFDLLVCLIRHRDRVLTREELFEAVWDGREVSDATLSNHVKSARKALGDSGELQQTIQTIRGRGYQFIAPVVEVEPERVEGPAEKAASPAAQPAAQPPPRSARPAWLRPVLAALLLLFAAGYGIARLFGTDEVAGRSDVPSILVLPIEVSGPDPDGTHGRLAEELTRRVISNLRGITGLHVKERATSFTFQDKRTHDYIRRELSDVRYVLDGVLGRWADKGLEITLSLDDVVTGKQIWQKRYVLRDGTEVTDLAEMQTAITRAVPRELQVTLLESEQRALGRSRELSTKNREALDLYMEGWRHLPLLDHDSLKQAIALFDKAIALDDGFYDAHMARGEALLLVYSYWDVPAEVLPKVVAAFEKAASLRPESAEPLSGLGLAYALGWDWNRAWKYLNAARAMNPNLAMTDLGFALYYCGLGESALVKDSLNRARINDPFNVVLADWGNWALFFVGEFNASRAWANDMMDKHPNVGFIVTDAAIGAYMEGDKVRAKTLAEQGHALDPSPLAKVLLAQVYGYAGEKDKVLPLLDEAARTGRYVCPYESAVAYLSIGDTKTAMAYLEDAYTKRSNCLVFLRVDRRLDPIRESPYTEQYQSLLARVGLDEEKFRSYPRCPDGPGCVLPPAPREVGIPVAMD